MGGGADGGSNKSGRGAKAGGGPPLVSHRAMRDVLEEMDKEGTNRDDK